MALDRTRTLRGALAGAAAAAVWAAQQPLDQRVFGVDYDDVELLGRFVTDGRGAYPIGLAMHLANGALFGALYANAGRALPVPAMLRGPLAGLAEHLATWPGTAALSRVHPAADDLPELWGSSAARPRPGPPRTAGGARSPGRTRGSSPRASAGRCAPGARAG